MNSLKEEVLFKSRAHGIRHNEKTAIIVFCMAEYDQLNFNDFQLLLIAALYHDVGRLSDGLDYGHGERSAKMIDYIFSKFDEIDQLLLKIVMHAHSEDDECFENIIMNYNCPKCEFSRGLLLMKYFKDADALDRFRLRDDGCDPNYLRCDISRSLIPFSKSLNQLYKNI